MKPPYDITSGILKLISSISEKIGEISASHIDRPSPQLRKQNKIKTIHSAPYRKMAVIIEKRPQL